MCMTFHTNAHDLAAEFLSEQGRITYVTPTSYLELIVAFKLALAEQREKITAGKDRYQNGLKQLAGAEDNVATMQVELTDLQPVLAEAQVATDQLMEEIEAKLPGAISASRGAAAPSRHRRDSCPSHNEVGGFFFKFERVSRPSRFRAGAGHGARLRGRQEARADSPHPGDGEHALSRREYQLRR